MDEQELIRRVAMICWEELSTPGLDSFEDLMSVIDYRLKQNL